MFWAMLGLGLMIMLLMFGFVFACERVQAGDGGPRKLQ